MYNCMYICLVVLIHHPCPLVIQFELNPCICVNFMTEMEVSEFTTLRYKTASFDVINFPPN